MSVLSFLFPTGTKTTELSLGEIFPLKIIAQDTFIKQDVLSTFKKILRDVLAKTHGLNDEQSQAMNDSCVATDAAKGLVTLLSETMYNQTDIYIVYKNNVIRIADAEEKKQIEADYKKQASSKVGIYVSFKNYDAATRLKLYSALEFLSTCSIYAQSNLSKSVQVKIDKLRASVSLTDADAAIAQAQAIASALKAGNATLLDSGDAIVVPTVDTSAIEKALEFINAKRAEILGMPITWLEGVTASGLSNSGEADQRAVERGLKFYFDWIIRPVCYALFGVKVTFKTQDFRLLTSALEALRTFDMTSDSYLPQEKKIEIVARVFDIEPEELKKLIKAEDAKRAKNSPTPPAPVAPAPAANGGAQ